MMIRQRRTIHRINKLILFLLLLGAGYSCSTTQNTFITRSYHAINTDYNIAFNGVQSYNKALKASEEKYKDDFSRLLPLHASQTYKTAVEVGSFKTSVEKAQKAIKLHSIKTPPKSGKYSSRKYRELVGIEEFNPVLYKAWLLMGRSHYYSGDFMSAIATFQYIQQHFRNLPKTVMEARLWLILSYLQMGWYYEAETLFEKIDRPQILSAQKPIFERIDVQMSIAKKEYAHAETQLSLLIASTSDRYQKARLLYLRGQLQMLLGHSSAAYESFRKVIRMNAPYELEFNARISQTETLPKSQASKIEKQLKSLAKQPKNKNYLDRIYYALGNIYLTNQDTARAIASYKEAVEKDTRKGKEMLTVNLRLADLLFNRRSYSESQPYYANAVGLMEKDEADYKRIATRSTILDELVVEEQSVKLQDSLLQVVAMPEAKRMELIRKKIKEVEEAEKREAENAARLKAEEQRASIEAEQQANNPQPVSKVAIVQSSADNSWYFYNTQTIARGKSEFQRKWGSRKLEDNWRRKNKSNLVYESPTEESTTATPTEEGALPTEEGKAKEERLAQNDPKKPEYYLAQLPKTQEEIRSAEETVATGLFNMAQIFKDKLEDYPLAIQTIEELNRRFPKNEHRLPAYYNLYIIGLRIEMSALSDKAKNTILTEYPDSQEAKVVGNPNYVKNYLATVNLQDSLYQAAYSAYNLREHNTVIILCRKGLELYPLSTLVPNYMYLYALSSIALGNKAEFQKTLKELIEKYPEAPLSEMAGNIVKGVLSGKLLQGRGSLLASSIWDQPIGKTEDKEENIRQFSTDPLTPHLVLFAFPADSIDKNKFLYEVAAFHFRNFKIKDFDMEYVNFEGIGMLKITPFLNYEELAVYRRFLYSEKGMGSRIPACMKPILISEDNFKILLETGRSFKEYETFYNEKIRGMAGQ